MAYIGAEPLPGQNREVDDISSGFNGSTTAFTLQVSSSNDDSLLVNLTDDGMSYGMKYERLVPILVNAIKELETRLAAVEAA